MQNEKFGKLMLECKSSRGKSLKRKLMFLIPALIFFAAGTIIAINPEIGVVTEEDAQFIPAVIAAFFAVGAVCVIGALLRSKQSSIALYENGVVYVRGPIVTEAGFDDIEGIRQVRSAAAIGGVLIRTPKALSQESVTIRKKDGVEIVLNKAYMSDFHQFADEFSDLYIRWLVKDLTMENIADANISFGPDLELSGGQFIYTHKKEKKYMPVGEVHGLEIQTDDEHNFFWLTSRVETDKKGRPKKIAGGQTVKALNLEALYHIVQMIAPQGQEPSM